MKQIQLDQRKHSQHSKPTRVPPRHRPHRLVRRKHPPWMSTSTNSSGTHSDSVSAIDSACSVCHGQILFVPVRSCDTADLDPVSIVLGLVGPRGPTSSSLREPSGYHDAGRAG